MNTHVRAVLMMVLAAGLGLLLTGCYLRSLFGNVIIVEDFGDEVNEIIATLFSHSTAAVCLTTPPVTDCTYIIDGEIVPRRSIF